ncbi:MAG: ribbon-helix-helix domain-containing protein [Candidatus Woesearchaeota archaeon]
METISLKMDGSLLKEIDKYIKRFRYSTRTEFIREAIRNRLYDIEAEIAIRRLANLKGSLKGKARMSDEKARELAFKDLLRGHKMKLD